MSEHKIEIGPNDTVHIVYRRNGYPTEPGEVIRLSVSGADEYGLNPGCVYVSADHLDNTRLDTTMTMQGWHGTIRAMEEVEK
jgi:hypothetical protein